MSKRGSRGQVTLFVVVAILIIAAIIAFILFRSGAIKAPVSAEEAERIVASQVQPIKDFVINCVKTPYENVVETIGVQGGFCSPASSGVKYSQLGAYSVPYLITKSGNSYSNNLLLLGGNGASISSEIVKCVNVSQIMRCINNFNSFKSIVDVTPVGELTFSQSFSRPTTIVVNIKYPLKISRGEATTSIEEMSFNLNTGLMNAYETAAEITNSEFRTHSFDIDSFSVRNPGKVMIERQGTTEGIYYYLKTFPVGNEKEYNFHFAVQR